MSGRAPSFIVLYDGQLSLDEKFSPTYIGGKTRPLQVPPNSNLQQLKTRIVRVLKCDPARYTVNIVGRFRVGNEYIASPVEDDEGCKVLLSLSIDEVIIIYVETVANPLNSNCDEMGPSQIHDDITPTLCDETVVVGVRRRVPIEQTTTRFAERDYGDVNLDPSMNTNHVNYSGENHYEGFQANVSEGYETMSSGSSDDGYEDIDDGIHASNSEIALNNNEINAIIHDYCIRTNEADVEMEANNEYRETCRNTEQWNSESINDFGNISNETYVIPVELVEGMCYKRKCDLQFAVQGWSIVNNVEYVVIASTKQVLTIACLQHDNQSKSCPWRLHARLSKRLGGIWKISTIRQQHSCSNPILLAGHRQCNSQFISFFLLPTIRKQLDLKPREIIGRVEAKFNIRVSYMKAWDARRKAIKAVFGSWEESYRTVNLFMEAVVSVMPGSVYKIQSSDSHRFRRMFWAFGPSISGWKFCRPVLSLDGTFLLGKYSGTLLIVVGLDANNSLFSLAFAKGSEIHLRYLPLLEDLGLFSTYSLGGAVLCHLYRELALATKPSRANIAGCIHLLQIWCWEHLHVGRPTLHVPQHISFDGLSVGYRWNEVGARQLPPSAITAYRDEIDGLLDSQVIWEPYTPEIRAQVAHICMIGERIWMARVPMISWTRVEWHLPDRVQRQFGYVPAVDLLPIDPTFIRSDGRGNSDTDWLVFYQNFIGIWEDRQSYIVQGIPFGPDKDRLIQRYLGWFRAWATLYMLKPPVQPPTSYYHRAPLERHLRNYFLESETTLKPYFGRQDLGAIQPAVEHMEELIKNMRQHMYIEDPRYTEPTHTPFSYFGGSTSQAEADTMMAGPSSQDFYSQPTLMDVALWPPDEDFPTTQEEPVMHAEEQHELRGRPLRPPQHYTPGTDAIPRRRKKKH